MIWRPVKYYSVLNDAHKILQFSLEIMLLVFLIFYTSQIICYYFFFLLYIAQLIYFFTIINCNTSNVSHNDKYFLRFLSLEALVGLKL